MKREAKRPRVSGDLITRGVGKVGCPVLSSCVAFWCVGGCGPHFEIYILFIVHGANLVLWIKDSKYGFGHDFGFSSDVGQLLKCGNLVSYCGENVVHPTQNPFLCGRFVTDWLHFESMFGCIK